jgi:hypothetical protein
MLEGGIKLRKGFIILFVLSFLLTQLSVSTFSASQAGSLIGTTERVSVSSSGAEGNDGSGSASISADGHYVTRIASNQFGSKRHK